MLMADNKGNRQTASGMIPKFAIAWVFFLILYVPVALTFYAVNLSAAEQTPTTEENEPQETDPPQTKETGSSPQVDKAEQRDTYHRFTPTEDIDAANAVPFPVDI